MKTSVIQIELHDDIGSLRDKMQWGQSNRILLVVPPQHRFPMTPLNLRLLKRHANKMGAQLALVTYHSQIIQNASALHIPTFSTIKQAQNRSWRSDQRFSLRFLKRHQNFIKPEDRRKAAKITKVGIWHILIFLFGVISPLILLLFLFPSATIMIPLQKQTQEIEVESRINLLAPQEDVQAIVQFAKNTYTLHSSLTAQATGLQPMDDSYAWGIVHVMNLTEKELHLQPETIFSTLNNPPIEFMSVEDIVIPAGVGMSADVEVKAILPGLSGNVAAQTIRVILGPESTNATAINFESMVGGAVAEITVVSQEDIATARDSLARRMKSEVTQYFQSKKTDSENFLVETLQLETSNEAINPTAGSPGNTFEISLDAVYSIWSYSQEQVEASALNLLDQMVEDDREGIPGTLDVSVILENYSSATNSSTITIRASRLVQKKLESFGIENLVAGKARVDVKEIIQQKIPGLSNVEMLMNPKWWFWMPFLPSRIKVAYQ